MRVCLSSVLFGLLFASQGFALTNSAVQESASFRSVVFFSSDQYDIENKEEVSGYCNGNLISQQVMITAAHCVFMAEVLNSKELEIQVGDYRYITDKTGATRRIGYITNVKEKVSAKFYFTKNLKRQMDSQGLRLNVGPDEDVAVVIFDRPLSVPDDFPFGKIISQSYLASITSKLSNYWIDVVTINPFEEIRTLDTKRSARLNRVEKSSGKLTSKSDARVQPGDSGAPVFARVRSEWLQIAVTKGRAENLFTSWNVFRFLDQKICEISEQVGDGELKKLLCY